MNYAKSDFRTNKKIIHKGKATILRLDKSFSLQVMERITSKGENQWL